jgi:hypothetical protein
MQLGGHATWCKQNPKVELTRANLVRTKTGKPLSEGARAKIKAVTDKKVVEGTWHNSFARSRKQTYAGQTFDGMWEVHLARWFDDHQIRWVRNRTSFPYTYDNKHRRYTPDFYVPVIDCYVEVKGWKTPKDEAKWMQFPKRLVVLAGSDLQSLGLPITVHKDWR